MKSLDDRIGEALSAADRDLLKSLDEPAFVRQALGLFRGRNAWVSTTVTLAQLVAFIGGVWAGAQFLAATDALAAVKWGLSAAVLLLFSVQFKMFLLSQMQTDRLLQALRLMEARLSGAGR